MFSRVCSGINCVNLFLDKKEVVMSERELFVRAALFEVKIINSKNTILLLCYFVTLVNFVNL